MTTLSSYITSVDGSELTYDLIRMIVRKAITDGIKKISIKQQAFYAITISSDVLPILRTISRGNCFVDYPFKPVYEYHEHKAAPNEVGAMHEVRFFMASQSDHPHQLKFITALADSHTIDKTDPFTFSIKTKEHYDPPSN